jgi:hypothetical protein
VLWLAANLGVRLDWGLVLPATILGVGTLLVLGGRHVRIGGIVAIGVLAALATLVLPLAPSSPAIAIGDQRVVVTDEAELAGTYSHGIGELVVDLSALELPSGTTFLVVESAVGDVTVVVPQGVAITGGVTVGIGEIDAFGARREGVRPALRLDVPGRDDRVLDLEVRALVGAVEVRR